jgi:hypothetical protein
MKQILLAVVILYLTGLSYAAFEPVSQFYLQVKQLETLNRIDSLKKQNEILKSRVQSLQIGYDSLYLVNVELVEKNKECKENSNTLVYLLIFVSVILILKFIKL